MLYPSSIDNTSVFNAIENQEKTNFFMRSQIHLTSIFVISYFSFFSNAQLIKRIFQNQIFIFCIYLIRARKRSLWAKKRLQRQITPLSGKNPTEKSPQRKPRSKMGILTRKRYGKKAGKIGIRNDVIVK